MADEGLFGELPEQAKPRAVAEPLGAPRLREPMREQIELRAVDTESLIGQEHPARVIWAYVEGLEHVVFRWNRDSQRGGFLIQTPCWKTEASMDDATVLGRHPRTGLGTG